MFVNGRRLKPLDPFHSDHPATIRGPEEVIKLGEHELLVQAFTLPHHNKVTPAQWQRHELPGGYLRNQGFYVYRERRLIIHGTWFRLARQAESTKLARVRIDIPNSIDSEWKIDVKKESAQLPAQIRDRLRSIINHITLPSMKVIRNPGVKLAHESPLPAWSRIQHDGTISYEINQFHPVVAAFSAGLSPELRAGLGQILRFVEATLPINALYADMASDPDKVENSALTECDLTHAIQASVETLVAIGVEPSVIVDMLQVTEPFRSSWDITHKLLDSMLMKGQ